MKTTQQQTFDWKKTYWNNNGKHEKQYKVFWEMFVPVSGKAETIEGEALRAISSIYYDAYNNGCCNIFDNNRFTSWDEDEILELDNYEIKDHYKEDIKMLFDFINLGYNRQQLFEGHLENIFLSDWGNLEKEFKHLENICDLVIEKVQNNILEKISA